MGFRSTFTSYDIGIRWPEWFKEKYAFSILFSDGPLQSLFECKTYDAWVDLAKDIQKAVDWKSINHFVLVYLHECGGITRCRIDANSIVYSEPDEWRETSGVYHHYCQGCDGIENS